MFVSGEGQFSCRAATEEDIPKITEIERRVQHDKWKPWSKENFITEFNKPYCNLLVMTDDETDNKIAGFIVFWIMFRECEILNLAVDFPYRGLGVAKELIRQAVSIAMKKDITKILLEVRKSNTPAIQLYQTLKFVITNIRKGFYSDGEDAYQMALYIDIALP
ncbi:MAG: ribosomal protein S18-alanine N-acetyltransferase [Bdellovibrionota bacterium]